VIRPAQTARGPTRRGGGPAEENAGRCGTYRLVAGCTLLALVALVALPGAPSHAQRAPGWDVRVSERVALAPGATGQLTIALAVDRGLTVSRDAAVIVDLAVDPGVVVKKRRLGRGDAVDPGADAPRFAINVRADAPGEYAVQLHIRFWVCGTRSCWPVEVRRAAQLAVLTSGTDTGSGASPGAPPGAPRR
jgi:hypothetical protein